MKPTRIVIHGASGRMGQAIKRLAEDRPEAFEIVALVTGGEPQSRVLNQVPCYSAKELGGLPDFDVMVDFSQPGGFDAALQTCVEKGRTFVSGTTGLSDAQIEAMTRASAQIPVLWASNFSLGVAVLHDLVERAARALPAWHCDIVESHHIHKQDAPSGTALTLGARAGANGAEVHYASLRAGDIVGEHLVQFTGMGERVELVHRATNRDIFAAGALHAAQRIASMAPGSYGMKDVIG